MPIPNPSLLLFVMTTTEGWPNTWQELPLHGGLILSVALVLPSLVLPLSPWPTSALWGLDIALHGILIDFDSM